MVYENLLNPELPAPEHNKEKRKQQFRLAIALTHLGELVSRIKVHNADPDRPWTIHELRLFGSVLRAEPMVGGVDVYLVHSLRPGWSSGRAVRWCINHYPSWYFRTAKDKTWWHIHLLRQLQGGSHLIKFSNRDPKAQNWPHVLVPLTDEGVE